MTEAELQKAVFDVARIYGWVIYHVPDSRRATARGCPDLIMINELQSRLLFAELKTTTGKLRPEQTFWVSVLEAAGIEVHVWRPGDLLEAVPKALRPSKKPEETRGDRRLHPPQAL